MGKGGASSYRLQKIPIEKVEIVEGFSGEKNIPETASKDNEAIIEGINLDKGKNSLKIIFLSKSRHSINLVLYEA